MAGEWGWWYQEEMSVIMYLMALENFHQLCSVDLIISDLVSE